MKQLRCEEVSENVALYLGQDLPFEAEEEFEAHLAMCPACAARVAEERIFLSLLQEAAVEPPAELLANCRNELRQELAPKPGLPGFVDRLRAVLNADWSRYLRPVAGLAVLAVAFTAGRAFEERRGLASAADGNLMRVRGVQGMGNGMVQLVLEEPRQRVVQGGLHDERIQQALLTAARQASDPGMRLESVDLLRNRCDNDAVRRTMTHALEKDESVGVRLRALEALRPCGQEMEVRQVLSRVLLRDASPTVRVQAIDLLADRTPAEFVGTLQEVIRRDENDYVRSRCLRVLSEMRASPGVF
jgi:hypothetical protein